MTRTASAEAPKGRKYDQVLRGAREVFLAQGFEGASVDEIARVAQVSKATLYAYFPDKRELFSAVVNTECEAQAERAIALVDDTAPPNVVLRTVGQQLVEIILSDFSMRVFRICMSEADRFPELGQAFYDSGPAMGRVQLGEYLRMATECGALNVDDPFFAADQFMELCKATLWPRAAFGIQNTFSEDEVDQVVGGAVDTFLARYGA